MSDIKPVRKRKRPVAKKKKQNPVEEVLGATSTLVNAALDLYNKAEPHIRKLMKGK